MRLENTVIVKHWAAPQSRVCFQKQTLWSFDWVETQWWVCFLSLLTGTQSVCVGVCVYVCVSAAVLKNTVKNKTKKNRPLPQETNPFKLENKRWQTRCVLLTVRVCVMFRLTNARTCTPGCMSHLKKKTKQNHMFLLSYLLHLKKQVLNQFRPH